MYVLWCLLFNDPAREFKGENNQHIQDMKTKNKLLSHGLSLLAAGAALLGVTATAHAADKKPNILVIWGDDIGTWNISHNDRGMMGYETPNIDRIAREGLAFTDYYGQQSCTAGRAAFLNGSVPVRTGMTKVGMPAAPQGWAEDRRYHRHCHEKPRLHHRTVRQKPPTQ